jgi:hypothetical protein
MKKDSPRIIPVLFLAIGLMVALPNMPYANITGGYPGYPGTWEGLTTNTIIEITLDTPVALVGNPPAPDIIYCVRKVEFSGLDFVFSDVPAVADVSADRKTIILYPTDVLGENGMYAYKIESINFEGGGSEQGFVRYYETGNNPVPSFATQIDEADMCEDDGNLSQLRGWCVRCHTDWKPFLNCIITP